MRESNFCSRIHRLCEEGREFATAELIGIEGSAPQELGAKMIVFSDGACEFTIGGGPFEAEVIRDSRDFLQNGSDRPLLVKEYDLTRRAIGMYCAGRVQVLIEAFNQTPHLVIFGGGHVGQALSRTAAATKLYHVTIIDDREEYASQAKHPAADRIILTDERYQKDIPSLGRQTYVVIVTRCHGTDKELIQRLAPRVNEVAYLGMIGSKSKIRQMWAELEKEGVARANLEKIHAPIGLPLGGKSPAEIAVAILAEIQQVRRNSSSLEQE